MHRRTRLNEHVKAFLESDCDRNKQHFIPCDLLYQYFKNWCNFKHIKPLSSQQFKIAFSKFKSVFKRYRPRVSEAELASMKLKYGHDFGLAGLDHPEPMGDVRICCYSGIDVKSDIQVQT